MLLALPRLVSARSKQLRVCSVTSNSGSTVFVLRRSGELKGRASDVRPIAWQVTSGCSCEFSFVIRNKGRKEGRMKVKAEQRKGDEKE